MSHRPRVSCPIAGCSKTFSRPADKSRHIDEVHGDLKQCPVEGCGWQNAKRKGRLEAHMKKKHQELVSVPLDISALSTQQQQQQQQQAASTYAYASGQSTSYQYPNTTAMGTAYDNGQSMQSAATYTQPLQYYYPPTTQPATYGDGTQITVDEGVGNQDSGYIQDEDVSEDANDQQYQQNYWHAED
ncbi:uncharacterized protein LY89DRAFT_731484 [Mollisia scopiformis]|uniref:C2H2-type domain-containing protein n=1 Tax=Mollisia scopiformis TaxID=149040 RepID=A0A194XFT7_MOLSC|nr:uncharacterized protein LY89DRAFT_731484 [Mollisia scopiformis]KUJ19060.1 hypothetical protein LY89DRAFT_731484 [Mollisia scopiformis]